MIDSVLVTKFYRLISTSLEVQRENTPHILAMLAEHPELANIRFSDFDLPDAKRPDPNRPLHFAIMSLNLELIEKLIALKADVKSDFPLIDAVRTGLESSEEWKERKLAALTMLLEAGADLKMKTDLGETALHYASRVNYQHYREVALLLLRYGADPNSRDISGSTPLHTHRCDSEVLQQMLRAGGHVHLGDYEGQTPLHLAVLLCEEEIPLLLAHGADVHQRDKYHRTPLHYAAMKDEPEKSLRLVALLLKAGAKPNVKDRQGYTPLHFAANAYTQETARLLLAAGADVSARSPKGLTPLKSAMAELHPDIVIREEQNRETMLALLREAGARE